MKSCKRSKKNAAKFEVSEWEKVNLLHGGYVVRGNGCDIGFLLVKESCLVLRSFHPYDENKSELYKDDEIQLPEALKLEINRHRINEMLNNFSSTIFDLYKSDWPEIDILDLCAWITRTSNRDDMQNLLEVLKDNAEDIGIDDDDVSNYEALTKEHSELTKRTKGIKPQAA
jgi:hypothetical protein